MRWKELAAIVQPPLLDKELAYMIMGTLKVQYLEKMVGSSFSTFYDIVTIGERIESHIKKQKLPNTTNASSGAMKPYANIPKKNDGEVTVVMGSSQRNEAHYHLPFHPVAPVQ